MIIKAYNLIRSLLLCLRYLPFKQAIRIPITFSSNVIIEELHRGCISFKSSAIKRHMVVFGLGGTAGLSHNKARICIQKGAKLILGENICLCEGTSIRIDNGGTLEIGDGMYCNKNGFFRVRSNIKFGNEALIGWNCCFCDYDGHSVIRDGKPQPPTLPIVIGNHVWVASNSTINKNVRIGDGSIVASGSVVTKQFEETNIMIGGVPASKIAENVDWKM